MHVALVALLAFAFSLLLMPRIIRTAYEKRWFDHPNERKIHSDAVPRLGGVGIFWAFCLSLIAAVFFSETGTDAGRSFSEYLWLLLACGFAVHLLGLWDDFKNINAVIKFGVQLVVAGALAVAGYRFRVILVPFGDGSLELGWLSYPLTMLWIIGVTNAVNLIDGMDGLAGGLSGIAASVFGLFFLLRGNAQSALVCFALVGSLVGFLAHNLPLPKARIFMGDSGSLFLGFILAVLPLLGPAAGVVEIGIVSAITTLLIPIFDTFTAIIRRKRAGVSFFSADKRHVHHKLLALGLSTPKALAVIYCAALGLGAVALSSFYASAALSFWLKIASWIACAGLFVSLHYATTPRRK